MLSADAIKMSHHCLQAHAFTATWRAKIYDLLRERPGNRAADLLLVLLTQVDVRGRLVELYVFIGKHDERQLSRFCHDGSSCT